MLTAGSALGLPRTAFDSSRTLALHFYVLSREGLSMTNAYATASTLIIAILLINLAAYWLMRRFVAKVA
jgi:phosphate transport system permease protein